MVYICDVQVQNQHGLLYERINPLGAEGEA
jgi:hypothetical protein